MKNELISDRLILNYLTPQDHVFIKALVNTDGWIKFIGDRNIHSAEDAKNYVNKLLNTNDNFYWVVRLLANGEAIGIITLVKRTYLGHSDLGFAFLAKNHGKGYAKEAAKLVVDETSNYPKYKILLAMTLTTNVSSKKLLENLHFVYKKNIKIENDNWELYQLIRN